MLGRLWADHRWACLVSLALVVVGVVVSPWVLLAAVVPIGWVLLKIQRSQEEKSTKNLPYEEPEIEDIKDESIIIPDEIKDLLGSSEWLEVKQGLELLASTGTIFSKWDSFELKDIINRIENEELDSTIRKILERINIEDISIYFWKEKISQEIANLKESELDEYISIESSGSLYQQDQAYLSKEEILERDEFNIQALIEMAESVNCCYGTTFEEELVLRLPNGKSIRIPKKEL